MPIVMLSKIGIAQTLSSARYNRGVAGVSATAICVRVEFSWKPAAHMGQYEEEVIAIKNNPRR